MNESYAGFVATAQSLAAERGLRWDLPCDARGAIPKSSRWDLTAAAGMMPPPSILVSSFAIGPGDLAKLNAVRAKMGQTTLTARPMSREWRDLYLAVIAHQIFARGNKPAHALALARWIRFLAAASVDTPPWAVTPDQVRQAYNAALTLGRSGKNALLVEATVKTILDHQKLADTPALARFCVPLRSSHTQHEQALKERARVNASSRTDQLRSQLSDRKRAARLPEQQAFWELVRILFTETPRTFSDAVRFALLKILIVTGLRISEAADLPFDWERWREYVDADGSLAGDKGGLSRSLMIRHFAAKQTKTRKPGRVSLYESAQHVPPLFEGLVLETLAHSAAITEPLRDRLRRQVETGRLFPEYAVDALVPAYEMYTRVTGNAQFSAADVPNELIGRYREAYGAAALEEIWDFQLERQATLAPTAKHWLRARQAGLDIRDSAGAVLLEGIQWKDAFLRVGDVEQFIRLTMPTKLPDVTPTELADGTPVYPHDLMFLVPIRNLIEGRNGGVLDVTRFCAAGRISTADVDFMLDGSRPDSIFSRYGATEQDQRLCLNSHALRHLQNGELFRLGVADTIITKRFNRRSVAQSHEYDHRSLAEDLANVDISPDAERALSEESREVYRMILNDKVSGPIIEEFRLI